MTYRIGCSNKCGKYIIPSLLIYIEILINLALHLSNILSFLFLLSDAFLIFFSDSYISILMGIVRVDKEELTYSIQDLINIIYDYYYI
jgi:hypothetical protein